MIIKKAILHIMDFNSDICVFSQQELDLSNSAVYDFIEKHIEKIHKDTGLKIGNFEQESHFAEYLNQYISEEIEFVDFSSWIANVINDSISLADNKDSTDLIAVDYIYDDVPFFGIFMLINKAAYTHQVINDDSGIRNEIIKHYAILPNTSQRIDSLAVINMKSKEIMYYDRKKYINGKDVMVLPERLLECRSTLSAKEAVKIIKETAAEVAEEYSANAAVTVSRAKSYIAENAEISDTFSPFDLGKEIFSDSPFMEEKFEQKLEEKNLPTDIRFERQAAIKTAKNHKIKTDTGIELTIPTEYFENEKFIEFINNDDGTISIELKNIGKIINR